MRYIRFLKVPKFEGKGITAVITITSDLGETFLDKETTLVASILPSESDGSIFLRKSLKWERGMRALPICFELNEKKLRWPIRVHVLAGGLNQNDLIGSPLGTELPNVVAVWSDSLDLPKGIKEASKTVERRFLLPRNRMLRMWEETGESIARHLWDGSIALTAYMSRMVARQAEGLSLLDMPIREPCDRKLKILELGCGCGMVGISLAQMVPDCQVFMTDVSEAQTIAERNIAVMESAASSAAVFVQLDWEADLPRAIKTQMFDVVLLSECTYNTDTIPELVRTICALASLSPQALVIVATKVRHPSESLFFDLMKQTELVRISYTKLELPMCSDFEECEHVDVHIFKNKTRCTLDRVYDKKHVKRRITPYLPPSFIALVKASSPAETQPEQLALPAHKLRMNGATAKRPDES